MVASWVSPPFSCIRKGVWILWMNERLSLLRHHGQVPTGVTRLYSDGSHNSPLWRSISKTRSRVNRE
jgi:hypothetical protein